MSAMHFPANLAPRDGELYLFEKFIPFPESASLLDCLSASLPWAEEEILIFGRRVKVPRLVCWHGDAGACYRYSGTLHQPSSWTSDLLALKARIETTTGAAFNSVLGNLYRDGADAMGWHADDEKELGVNPVIASLSLGAERLFRLRHKRGGGRLDLCLKDGDLLLMAGALQHHWRHCLPKTRQPTGVRINLTFRKIWLRV